MTSPIDKLRRWRGGPLSFRARLTVGTTLLCFAVLSLASGSIYLGVRQALLWNLDNALLSIARTEIARLVDDPRGEVQLHEDYPAPLNLAVGAGYDKLAQIQDAEGRIIAQTANLRDKPPLPAAPDRPSDGPPDRALLTDIRRGDATFRAIYYPLRDPLGNPMLAIVALPKAPVDYAIFMLWGTLGLTMLVGTTAAAFGSNRLNSRLTRPLETIAAAAQTVRDGDLTSRIPESMGERELCAVASTLNDMLDRLEASFESQEQMIESQMRFIGDASHELRSPLSNLRGTIEVVLRRPRQASEYKEALLCAHAETIRMCRLVDDLLTLSRADAGQCAVQFTPCDLSYLARQSAVAHAALASESEVMLHVNAAHPHMVEADRDRLRQAIDNLLDNALRYSRSGSAVTLTTWTENGSAYLSVQDEGPGLTPEEQERIFERFYRADKARARHSGGLGLGLSIVSAIIKAHGGALSVQSEPGRGATFAISLPSMADADVAAPAALR